MQSTICHWLCTVAVKIGLASNAARNWLRKRDQLVEWLNRATRQLEEVFANYEHYNQAKWRRLLPHANFLLKMDGTESDNKARVDLMGKCATSLYYDGRYDEAELLFMQVMESRKTKLEADHPDTLSSMANLASTYRNQGRWEEAEKVDVQVMESRKTKLGADHPDTLTSMNNLAFTWKAKAKMLKTPKFSSQPVK